jgi:hypothetical protein
MFERGTYSYRMCCSTRPRPCATTIDVLGATWDMVKQCDKAFTLSSKCRLRCRQLCFIRPSLYRLLSCARAACRQLIKESLKMVGSSAGTVNNRFERFVRWRWIMPVNELNRLFGLEASAFAGGKLIQITQAYLLYISMTTLRENGYFVRVSWRSCESLH